MGSVPPPEQIRAAQALVERSFGERVYFCNSGDRGSWTGAKVGPIMGRPYAEEMSALATTYAWAQEYDISVIQRAVLAASSMPLVAVGSGGSMTTATWLAYLHRKAFRVLAHTATPLQLEALLPMDRQVSVWLLTASGRNKDIIRGLETAVLAEPRQLVVLCAAAESPLRDKAAAYPWTTRLGFDSPAGRDGFLASNSLLATCVLLARSVLAGTRMKQLPNQLDTLLESALPDAHEPAIIDERCAALWQRDTLLVLHGNTGHVAATDIESRFTEAALGCVQLADFRNFAHGRHHWLAKRGATSAVLAIVDPGISKLADQTLQLLPEDIPVARFELSDDGFGSALAAICLALRLAQSAGRTRGIDPGRPGVPEFGRRIYHLRPPRSRLPGLAELTADESIAIERKVGVPLARLDDELESWHQAYTSARDFLKKATIRAVVLDHDGTLVTTEKRFHPPESEVATELVRLLELGVPLGIATGRGDSIRGDLRAVIPRVLWPHVLIGYRNGSELGRLDQDGVPTSSDTSCEELVPIVEMLRASPLARTMSLRVRPQQISITCETPLPDGMLWTQIMEALHGWIREVQIVRSSHSVDILAPSVSKRAVVEHIARQHGIEEEEILRIGDRGRWPGNDFQLLDDPMGLSVDEVSRRPDACWNLGRPGERGVATTLRYLRLLSPASKRDSTRLRLRLKKRRT